MNRSIFKLQSISESLTESDKQTLLSLFHHRLLTTPQLRRLFFSGGGNMESNGRLARSRLAKLEQKGLVSSLARRIGGVRAGSAGQVWRLTALGSRLSGYLSGEQTSRGRETYEPSEAFVRHTLACGEVFVQLSEAARAGLIELLEFEAEPSCWRSFSGGYGETSWLKPDGFVRIGVGEFEERAFVEVDLGTHGRAAVRRKLGVYSEFQFSGQDDANARVLWLVPDEPRCRWIGALVEELPVDVAAAHQVAGFDDLTGVLLRETTSTTRGGET